MATESSTDRGCEGQRIALIEAAYRLQRRVEVLRDEVSDFYNGVILLGKPCVTCGSAGLTMVRTGWAKCSACGAEFDATRAFQTCPECDSVLVLKVTHYWCPACRTPVRSLYCIDGPVLDLEYFRDKMRESRERKRQDVERVRLMLAESRSASLSPWADPEKVGVAGIHAAIDTLAMATPQTADGTDNRPAFDFESYRAHIQDLTEGCVVDFEGVSPLIADRRLDRVFRFITAVFMDQEGILDMEQSCTGSIVLVGS